MLRVLHITNAFPYPEVPEYGVFVKEQVDSLNRAGVQADVLFINGRYEGKKAYIQAIKDIRRRAKDYDVLHCHHLYSGFATALALPGKPTVLSFQNDWLHEMDTVPSPLLRRLGCNFGAHWASRVIFKSPIPPQFAGQKRFVHLPNGVNSTQFHITPREEARQRLGLSPSKVYVLFVSSKDKNRPQKRYDRFSEAMNLLREDSPDRQIEELVLVNQPRERVLDFFNAADIHLMTSDYEGSPNSVKEALSCGVPVVTTDVGNVREMLADVPACHVAPVFDASTLADLARQTLTTKVSREEIRESFLSKGLSQQQILDRLLMLYSELAPAGKKTR